MDMVSTNMLKRFFLCRLSLVYRYQINAEQECSLLQCYMYNTTQHKDRIIIILYQVDYRIPLFCAETLKRNRKHKVKLITDIKKNIAL